MIPASWMWIFSGFFPDSKLNVFGLWTEQDVFIEQTTDQLIEKTIGGESSDQRTSLFVYESRRWQLSVLQCLIFGPVETFWLVP